jgi:hypothetical protein
LVWFEKQSVRLPKIADNPSASTIKWRFSLEEQANDGMVTAPWASGVFDPDGG